MNIDEIKRRMTAKENQNKSIDYKGIIECIKYNIDIKNSESNMTSISKCGNIKVICQYMNTISLLFMPTFIFYVWSSNLEYSIIFISFLLLPHLLFTHKVVNHKLYEIECVLYLLIKHGTYFIATLFMHLYSIRRSIFFMNACGPFYYPKSFDIYNWEASRIFYIIVIIPVFSMIQHLKRSKRFVAHLAILFYITMRIVNHETYPNKYGLSMYVYPQICMFLYSLIEKRCINLNWFASVIMILRFGGYIFLIMSMFSLTIPHIAPNLKIWPLFCLLSDKIITK